MTISEATTPEPVDVTFDEESMWVRLEDGRTLGVPISWYPRLLKGTPAQRAKFFLSPSGIHWEELDEDISVAGILRGLGDRTVRPHRAA